MLTAIIEHTVRELETEEIGRFVIDNGALAMRFPASDPGHHPPGDDSMSPVEVLEELLATPLRVYDPAMRQRVTVPTTEPERWLRTLPLVYRNGYFWARLEDAA